MLTLCCISYRYIVSHCVKLCGATYQLCGEYQSVALCCTTVIRIGQLTFTSPHCFAQAAPSNTSCCIALLHGCVLSNVQSRCQTQDQAQTWRSAQQKYKSAFYIIDSMRCCVNPAHSINNGMKLCCKAQLKACPPFALVFTMSYIVRYVTFHMSCFMCFTLSYTVRYVTFHMSCFVCIT